MDKRMRAIAEDLLPLYNEGLLSEETSAWLREQLAADEQLRRMAELSKEPITAAELPEPPDYERMMRSINRKLSLYQLLFVALSFYLAIRASLLNESFSFILWYAVLGLVTYGFYRSMRIVFVMACLPIFMWSVGSGLAQADRFGFDGIVGIVEQLAGAVMLSLIHYAFALAGACIGWLVIKAWGKGGRTR